MLPAFKERDAIRQKQKAEELAPYIAAAFKRKKYMQPLADADIPVVQSYGRRKNTDISVSKAEVLGERGGGFSIPSFDPHAKKKPKWISAAKRSSIPTRRGKKTSPFLLNRLLP